MDVGVSMRSCVLGHELCACVGVSRTDEVFAYVFVCECVHMCVCMCVRVRVCVGVCMCV